MQSKTFYKTAKKTNSCCLLMWARLLGAGIMCLPLFWLFFSSLLFLFLFWFLRLFWEQEKKRKRIMEEWMLLRLSHRPSSEKNKVLFLASFFNLADPNLVLELLMAHKVDQLVLKLIHLHNKKNKRKKEHNWADCGKRNQKKKGRRRLTWESSSILRVFSARAMALSLRLLSSSFSCLLWIADRRALTLSFSFTSKSSSGGKNSRGVALRFSCIWKKSKWNDLNKHLDRMSKKEGLQLRSFPACQKGPAAPAGRPHIQARSLQGPWRAFAPSWRFGAPLPKLGRRQSGVSTHKTRKATKMQNQKAYSSSSLLSRSSICQGASRFGPERKESHNLAKTTRNNKNKCHTTRSSDSSLM